MFYLIVNVNFQISDILQLLFCLITRFYSMFLGLFSFSFNDFIINSLYFGQNLLLQCNQRSNKCDFKLCTLYGFIAIPFYFCLLQMLEWENFCLQIVLLNCTFRYLPTIHCNSEFISIFSGFQQFNNEVIPQHEVYTQNFWKNA